MERLGLMEATGGTLRRATAANGREPADVPKQSMNWRDRIRELEFET